MKENIKIGAVKDYYDQNVVGKLKGFVYGNERVEKAWNEMNNWITEPENILEIGCGVGDISWRLSERFPKAKILGFDVSEKSIEIANKLFKNPRVSFKQANDISLLKNKTKFDLIFLFDVFEHIPIELRENLFSFISNNLCDSGIVFISCPSIAHQQYLKQKRPEGLQPIDEDISIKELILFSEETGLPLLFYKEVSVWNTGDYIHAVFGCRKYLPIAKENEVIKNSTKKIALSKLFKSKMPKSQDLIQLRLDIIKRNLNEEILTLIMTSN